ncbi:MAG: diguanylate cyclase, partial [Coprobacillus sp.]
LGIYGNGNGLFTLFGFFYLLPLRYLYKESFLKQMFIICFCWIYTLIVFSIAMQLGFIFEEYGRFLVVVISETLIFACTFYWARKFVIKIYMTLIECKEKGILNYLNKTSFVWFLTILSVNMLFVFYDNSYLKIITICIIGYNVVFTYKLLYEMLNKRNEIGLLKSQVARDDLTCLGSRIEFHRILSKLVKSKKSFYLIYLDLDDFKYINDHYGHIKGDLYLSRFSQELSNLFRYEQLYRISGDEFVVLDNMNNIEDVINKINSIYFELDNQNIKFLGVSYGYANYPNDGRESDELIHHADKQMYRTKKLRKQNND